MNILLLRVRPSSFDVWNLTIGNSLTEAKVSNAKLQVWAGEISQQGPCLQQLRPGTGGVQNISSTNSLGLFLFCPPSVSKSRTVSLRRDKRKPPDLTWTQQPGRGTQGGETPSQSGLRATPRLQLLMGALGRQQGSRENSWGLCSPKSPKSSLSNRTAENVVYLYPP